MTASLMMKMMMKRVNHQVRNNKNRNNRTKKETMMPRRAKLMKTETR